MPQTVSTRKLGLLFLGLVALAVAAAIAGYRISLDFGLAEVRTVGHHRTDLYASTLEREIGKYAYFPSTLALERDVLGLLRTPDPIRAAEVNTYLARLNDQAKTAAIYVLNEHGTVIASSNAGRSDSFVGENDAYRPYFSEARIRGTGRFFGIGTTRSEPGYYLSSVLNDGETFLGVAVVKVSLEQLERSWAALEHPALVADENGVVILASSPEWKFSTLTPLSPETRDAFDKSRQYNRLPLPPLSLSERRRIDPAARIVELPRRSVSGPAGNYLAQTAALPGTTWTLTVFSPLAQVEIVARARAALFGVGTALFLAVLMIVWQRSRYLRAQIKARDALQRANDELERKVAERTADLSAANEHLTAEVAERTRAERTLRTAQDELAQAGKLASLGQLSAGLAHELNQPLAALRTLSGNAIKYLERGEPDTAAKNLERIAQLVDGMGLLTGQLKTFARKSGGNAHPFPIGDAIDNALFLLEHRTRRAHVEIVRDIEEEPLLAYGDINRLEQVLVNLIGNALDAMEGTQAPILALTAFRQNGTVVVSVKDTGPGLNEDVRQRLFEPFFTTKAEGSGLGLGLAISAGIVRDFGGTLSGENRPDGGAVFTVTLPEYHSDGMKTEGTCP